MDSNDELKKTDIKNPTYSYFDDINLILIFFLMKDRTKIFWFMTFYTKLCLVQNHCVLGSIR